MPVVAAGVLLGLWMSSGRALAHCDGMDGPVVSAARQALEKNDVNRVLVWVQKKDEAEIREAFRRTREVRRLSRSSRDLADLYFFETLVRVHRAGEGAPYTGLKPAGRDLGPAIPAADRALETGDVEPLVKLLRDAMDRGVRERFEETRAARSYAPADVDRGREYVEKYVPFIHYVERLYESATTSAHGHQPETEAER
jgi:hypothetical protein